MEQKQSIAEMATWLTEPFKHRVVGQVDDYCAYLIRIEGTYLFHQHAKDEMYLALEGEIGVDTPAAPASPWTRGRARSCRWERSTVPV